MTLSTGHLHFAIFELGPEQLGWKRKAVNPNPDLVDAVGAGEIADNLLFLVARTRRHGAVIEAKAGISIRSALR